MGRRGNNCRGGCCCCFHRRCRRRRGLGCRGSRGGNDRSSRRGDCDGWTCNDGPDGRPARDGRCRWGCHDVRLRARLRHDAARLRGRGCVGSGLESGLGRGLGLGCGCRGRRSCGGDPGGCRRGYRDGGRRRDNGGRARRRGFGCGFGLLALEDGFEGVAGFRDLGEVKLRLVVGRLPACGAASAAVPEILPDPFGLVGLDGAGVGLSGHADCFERVQDWPALDFQFSCQIVNSNFVHPSLFGSRALSCSYQPHGGLYLYCKCSP